MYFANPWGLLGLVAVPTILFIHLYQRRFPVLEIAGLHLWADEEQTKTAGRRLDRLPITRSLLFELLAALLLTALLAQPRFNNLATAEHWIIVLDDSASMLSQPPGRKSFRDQAIEEIESRARGGRLSSRFTVILTGRRPAMLAGPAGLWSTASEQLQSWQPEATRHDFQPAWDMASQLADASGELLFITDDIAHQAELPGDFELVSLGQPLSNLAFETVRWSLDSQTLAGSLYLRLKNYSSESVTATLLGESAGQEVLRQDVFLNADESIPFSTTLPGGIKQLRVQLLSPSDRLATDSVVELIEPAIRTVRVGVALEASHPGREQVIRMLRTLPDIELVDADEADLVLAPADANAVPAAGQWLVAIGPLTRQPEPGEQAKTTAGPFLLERRNPILEGLSMQGVVWGGIQAPENELTPLISAGSDILLGEYGLPYEDSFLLNIDLSKSNLSNNPDWPILWSNLMEACRDALPGLRRWNYRINELVRFDLPASDELDDETLLLRHDSFPQPRSLMRSRLVEIPPLSATGIYELSDGQKTIDRFSANFFDGQESDLSGLAGGVRSREVRETAAGMQFLETAPWIWMLLIVLTLIAAFGNWAVLKPQPDKVGAA